MIQFSTLIITIQKVNIHNSYEVLYNIFNLFELYINKLFSKTMFY